MSPGPSPCVRAGGRVLAILAIFGLFCLIGSMVWGDCCSIPCRPQAPSCCTPPQVCCPGPCCGRPPHIEDVLRQASVSVKLLDAMTGEDQGSGSGTIIGVDRSHAYILTAGHVSLRAAGTDAACKLRIVQSDPRGKAKPVMIDQVQVLAVSEKYDLALLRTGKHPFRVYARVYRQRGPPELDTRLYHCGDYLGLFPASIGEGKLRGLGRDPRKALLLDQGDYNACPGSSGGGVFLADGSLAGVHVRGYRQGGAAISLFVPARAIRAWAREMKWAGWQQVDSANVLLK